MEVVNGMDTHTLRNMLETQYPRLKQIRSYMVALNNEYTQGGELIQATDEIAIIPPVSGG
jgi:molybdopterin synthase sulfur carrier subunit